MGSQTDMTERLTHTPRAKNHVIRVLEEKERYKKEKVLEDWFFSNLMEKNTKCEELLLQQSEKKKKSGNLWEATGRTMRKDERHYILLPPNYFHIKCYMSL